MNRSNAGRVAKFSGDVWEGWLNTQHEKAKHLGILAHITHTQAIAKMVQGRLMYTEKGDADYVGCLEGGKTLVVEAKSTKDARFPRNDISSNQQTHLERVARAGGLSLLLIEFRDPTLQRFAVPWLEIRWQIKRTAESIAAVELQGFEVYPDCYLKRWHEGGTPSTPIKVKTYPRE